MSVTTEDDSKKLWTISYFCWCDVMHSFPRIAGVLIQVKVLGVGDCVSWKVWHSLSYTFVFYTNSQRRLRMRMLNVMILHLP